MIAPLVLLAEDDPIFAHELSRFFVQEGWEAEVVHDGLAALGRLRQEPAPTLVCLDLVLPGLDGWRFYAEVRRNDSFPQVPIVVLTGARQLPDENLHGIVAFVRKPSNEAGRERFEQQLRAAIEQVAKPR